MAENHIVRCKLKITRPAQIRQKRNRIVPLAQTTINLSQGNYRHAKQLCDLLTIHGHLTQPFQTVLAFAAHQLNVIDHQQTEAFELTVWRVLPLQSPTFRQN